MDPMSALGLAANIVQFVDFGSKLLERANEIRKSASGQLEEHTELETITKSLARASHEFELSVARNKNRQLTFNDESIQAICRDSQVVADKLLDALNKLKSQEKGRKWVSAVHALKSMWGQEEIDSLKGRLDGFRQQLIVAILVALR
jgi:CHASE3 domain sensor protein